MNNSRIDITHRVQAILFKAGNHIHGRDSEESELTYSSIVEWKQVSGLLTVPMAGATVNDDYDDDNDKPKKELDTRLENSETNINCDVDRNSKSRSRSECKCESNHVHDNNTRSSEPPNRKEWYQTGYNYWEDESNCPATVDGVLGGFASISQKDLQGSEKFLMDLKSEIRPELKFEREGGATTRACECGAGK